MKRSTLFGITAVAATAFAFASVACKEEFSNPVPLGINAPRQAGVDTGVVVDAAPDAPQEAAAPIVDAGMDTNDGAPIEVYVSDLAYTVVANGYGAAEKDKSNGEAGDNDGVTMTLDGVQYAKGIGVHAASEITVALNGQYKRFLSDVGLDDEIAAGGSIVFRVVVDGTEMFNSDVMNADTPMKKIDIDVTGKNTMQLFVDDGGDGNGADHGDWANARLRK